MTRALTPAEAALAAAQKAEPPLRPRNRHGHDRVQALAVLLDLPDGLRQRLDDGRLAWGEIGKWRPDAHTYPVAADYDVIEVTSGYMDFVFAVGRAMAGTSVVYAPDGRARNKQALPVEEVAALVAGVFSEWQKHCQPKFWDLFRKSKRIKSPDFPLSEPAHDIAETLVTCAELFTIAHELGHVALRRGSAKPAHDNKEVAADLAGLDLYLPTVVRLLGERVAFVGPALAVRITEGLTRCGVTFSDAYPPARQRLDHIIRHLRRSCLSTQYFDEASTMMVANIDFMGSIDDINDPRDVASAPNAWHGLVGAIAALQSLLTEKRPPSTFLEMFERGIKGQLPEVARGTAQTLKRYYQPQATAPSFFDEELRRAMGEALDQCIALMPNDRQALFS